MNHTRARHLARHCTGIVFLTAACHSAPPAVEPDPVVTPARMAPAEAPVSCATWVQRAVANPDLDVERVPEPLAYDPPPIPRRLPKGVVGKDGRAEVRVQVMVDTLGKPDMATFKVVTSTSTWLSTNVKKAVTKWTFRPAEVGGCKVPRHFNWGATAGKPPAPARKP